MPFKHESSVKTEIRLKRPKMFAIVMHNDDYTSMEFVVEVLQRIFHKNEIDAHTIMLEVHTSGKSIVGVYTYDIAATKKNQTDQMASEKGFPLKVTVEEAIE